MKKEKHARTGVALAWKILLFVTIISVMSSSAFALGIRPAKSELLLVDGTAAGSFVVVNNEGGEQELKVYVEGPYSGLVEIAEPAFTLPAGGEKLVQYVLDAKDLVVGSFNIYLSPDTSGGEGFGAAVRISHRVNFREAEAIVPSGAAVALPPLPEQETVVVEQPAPPSQEVQQPAPSAQPQPSPEPLDLSAIVLAGGIVFVLGAFELWLRSRKKRY